MIILNNEGQDLDDIPTEEEELNLANILQATENTRTQTFVGNPNRTVWI